MLPPKTIKVGRGAEGLKGLTAGTESSRLRAGRRSGCGRGKSLPAGFLDRGAGARGMAGGGGGWVAGGWLAEDWDMLPPKTIKVGRRD